MVSQDNELDGEDDRNERALLADKNDRGIKEYFRAV